MLLPAAATIDSAAGSNSSINSSSGNSGAMSQRDVTTAALDELRGHLLSLAAGQ